MLLSCQVLHSMLHQNNQLCTQCLHIAHQSTLLQQPLCKECNLHHLCKLLSDKSLLRLIQHLQSKISLDDLESFLSLNLDEVRTTTSTLGVDFGDPLFSSVVLLWLHVRLASNLFSISGIACFSLSLSGTATGSRQNANCGRAPRCR